MQDIFCERLKNAREMRGLTQSELGAKAKLPPSSIAHFETGTRKPSFDTLRSLANALEVTTDYLLGRVETPEFNVTADVRFRDMSKLTSTDRELAESFLKLLAERNIKK
ncbi:hypothetical protein FACS1894130_05160 [Spirochaetia bacterium]|nr:hypothetical protein FACS1894130_05160 [Spirochaetia bacterium]